MGDVIDLETDIAAMRSAFEDVSENSELLKSCIFEEN